MKIRDQTQHAGFSVIPYFVRLGSGTCKGTALFRTWLRVHIQTDYARKWTPHRGRIVGYANVGTVAAPLQTAIHGRRRQVVPSVKMCSAIC